MLVACGNVAAGVVVEMPCEAGCRADVRGILRLRQPIHKPNRLAALRMTGVGG